MISSTHRLDHEDARAHGRIPTIPVPDVRFEQSYLMSIQREQLTITMLPIIAYRLTPPMTAFIHSQAIPIHDTDDTEDKEDITITDTPSKLRKDKRRRVEESLALVDDPASRKGSPLDDLLHPSSGRQVNIQWSQIAYITIRDQVRFTLYSSLSLTACILITPSQICSNRSSRHLYKVLCGLSEVSYSPRYMQDGEQEGFH